MASSVASAKEMERWKRERNEARQRTVHMKPEAARQFNSFNPDLDQLATFERKAQELAERQQDREEALEVTPVINVMGSTAGAGSGEFHTYRGYRAKEMARLADFERERKQEKAQAAWEAERAEAAAEAEAKHEKNAAKRNKKKEKRKAAIDAEKEAKRAAREQREQQQQQQSGGGGEAESSAPAAAAEADEPAAAAAEEAGKS